MINLDKLKEYIILNIQKNDYAPFKNCDSYKNELSLTLKVNIENINFNFNSLKDIYEEKIAEQVMYYVIDNILSHINIIDCKNFPYSEKYYEHSWNLIDNFLNNIINKKYSINNTIYNQIIINPKMKELLNIANSKVFFNEIQYESSQLNIFQYKNFKIYVDNTIKNDMYILSSPLCNLNDIKIDFEVNKYELIIHTKLKLSNHKVIALNLNTNEIYFSRIAKLKNLLLKN
jgi:2C-methyl-D-erythritol 2,4-cyclodiphosphate synthase